MHTRGVCLLNIREISFHDLNFLSFLFAKYDQINIFDEVIKESFFLVVDTSGNQLGTTLMNDLQEQEKELQQYMLQLENAESARASLLSQLKDALQEQV